MSAPIPVFSDRPKAVSTPKLRALVKFPGNVQGGAGIEVTKAHGTWTIELDYNDFAKLSAPPTGANNYVLNYDALTQSYALVPTGAISTANVVDVRNFGAACDTVQIEATAAAHISIASDLITLTAPGASFTVADVGKTIIVPTAGPSGTGLQAFIASVITDTKIILSRPAAASIDSTTLLLTYGTDDTASIQAAVDTFARRGVNINLSGKMLITAPIVINQSADTRPNTTEGTAINLRGGGSGSTYIIHSGCFNGPAIEFIGNELPSPSFSITSQQTWQGFTLASAVAGATGTAGISIAVMAFSKFFDIMIYGLEVGISATDLLSSSFYGCNVYNTKQGITAAFSVMSRPNAISFHGCEFGSCSDYGIGFTGSTAITIVGGAFQGCGNHTSGLGSIYLANPNVEGGVALSCYGAYFEANSGLADIVLSKSSADQSLMILDGCDFHRSSADHCIAVVQGTGAGRVDLVCRSSFRHFPPYVLPGLPAIVFISDAGCEYSVDTSGSFFADKRYSWSETTLTPHAMVKFLGATGAVINSTGVIGVAQNSTGSYTIHLRNAMRSTNPILTTSMTDVGEVVDFGSTASFVSVRTLSTAGAVFNPTSVSVVIYDGAA